MSTPERQYTVTCVRRHSDGYWTAHVTPTQGPTIPVHRRYGSWQADPTTSQGHTVKRSVLPHVAALLQVRVRRLERAETPRPEGAGK